MRHDTKIVLTIAGTDPSGGAGINADLQVFRDFGVHGVAAITAVVWQNSRGVIGWREVEPEDLRLQLEAVFDDFPIGAIKIGMVPTGDLMLEIRHLLQERAEAIPVVLDPVMASGSGDRSLMAPTGHRGLQQLTGVVDLLTPNGPEAREMVAGADELSPEELVETLLKRGWKRVLLKGGHLREEHTREVQDYYGDETGVQRLSPLQVRKIEIRGSGCQLSSAIAAERAHGASWLDAVERARHYLNHMRSEKAQAIGGGVPIVVRAEARDGDARR